MQRSVSALALLVAAGCSPFDGTWLFHVDYQPSAVNGTCVEDWDSSVVWQGTDDMFVDIYTTSDHELVVMFEQYLKGEPDGTSFKVSSESIQITDDLQQGDRVEMRADLEGGTLSGKVTDTSITRHVDSTESCEVSHKFKAERSSSNPDRYAQD